MRKLTIKYENFVKLIATIILCFCLLQCSLVKPNHPVPQHLEQAVKNLYEQYPPPQDFEPFDNTPRAIFKSDRGTYGGWYGSEMNSEDVNSYYFEKLANDNWVFSERSSYNISTSEETKYFEFEREGFYINLSFEDKKPLKGEKKTYSLDYGFTP